ncbi:MAG: MBL fold metallo-hydrolase [Acidobacteria bacterium]|nr:MAG: MBL fold metallo-hydrolase [Acidobacteriota bacterium]
MMARLVRSRLASVLALLAIAAAVLSAQRGGTTRMLDIYWVDVEGGAATLIVSPSGESLLVDTGWRKDDRDARRIHEVATRVAGLRKIDYLITTHFHADHVGGVGALSTLIPIDRFLDHGDTVENRPGPAADEWAIYQDASKGKRSQPKLGDKIPLEGLDITVVAVNGDLIPGAINGGGPNAPELCSDPALKKPDNGENGRSVGFLLVYGTFEFLDLGDLTWNKEIDMVCPVNRLGKVDLLQVNHHGMDLSGAPQFVNSVGARVAIMNNGPRKGGIGSYLDIVKRAPGLEDLWQLHLSLVAERERNTAEQFIANLDEEAACTGHYLKASIAPDGRYTITNTRNNVSRAYASR